MRTKESLHAGPLARLRAGFCAFVPRLRDEAVDLSVSYIRSLWELVVLRAAALRASAGKRRSERSDELFPLALGTLAQAPASAVAPGRGKVHTLARWCFMAEVPVRREHQRSLGFDPLTPAGDA